MANIYKYSDSNEKNGFYLKSASDTSGYSTIQTTEVAEKLFNWMGKEHGDELPNSFTRKMFNLGLLTTIGEGEEQPTSDELKSVFDNPKKAATLTTSDFDQLKEFIENYSGEEEEELKELGSILDIPNHTEDPTVEPTRGDSIYFSSRGLANQIRVSSALEEWGSNADYSEIKTYPNGIESVEAFNEVHYNIDKFVISESNKSFAYRLSPDIEFEIVGYVEALFIFDYTIREKDATERSDYELLYFVQMPEGYQASEKSGLISHKITLVEEAMEKWEIDISDTSNSDDVFLRCRRQQADLLEHMILFFDEFEGYSLESPGSDLFEIGTSF